MMNKKIKNKTYSGAKRRMKRTFSILMLLCFTVVLAQNNLSTDYNFIYTKTCLDADCVKKTEAIQYFDGLGRPVQTIAIKATPLGRDVIMPVEYNTVGKQVKDYLPIPQQSTSSGAFYTNFSTSIYGNETIYSEKIYDNVYTDRVRQVVPVGNAWAQKPVNLGYDTNTDGEVKKYTMTTSWVEGRTDSGIPSSSPYSVNQLMKTAVTDEDNNTTIEFQNGEGQTVLVRKNDGTQDVDTYYLYNEYGQLAYVIPPLAVNAALDQATLDNLCYQYRYDGMGKLVEKKIPGKGWEYIIYDKQDRVIMTQDANLRRTDNTFQAKGWMFIKYDAFSRVVYTGFFPNTDSRTALQTQVNNITVNPGNNEARTSGSFTSGGMEIYYSQNAFPSSGVKVMGVNYYDTYPAYSFNPAFPTSVVGQAVITDVQNSAITTKALATMSLVKNIEDDNWTKSYIWYDNKSRPIATHLINHLGGAARTEIQLDFAGAVQQTKAYHKRLSSDTEKLITQNFEYDSQNRVKKVWHNVEGSGNSPELLMDNSYNELSQLENKKVGNALQSIDYTYNIRGAVTKLNDPANLGTKLFGYEVKYFNPQNTVSSTGKYNGNITEVTWKTATDNVLRQYNYQYDALNRLKKGIYSEPYVTVNQNDFYNEEVTYDLNGNIKGLKRYSKPGTGNTPEKIDDLIYDYTGNRLDKIRLPLNVVNNPSGYNALEGAIDYDDNGNMTKMEDKGISNIAYNFMGLPSQITQNGNTILYAYSSDGTKLKKAVSGKTTEYMDGFQYENGVLKFVPTSEGYYNFENNKYIYSYTDHLGNVRLSYTKNGSGTEIIEENNFYPFGLKHQGYNAQIGNPAYKYQYNGKELQEETGWNDYGARMYMSDLGRWGVIDPLAEMMTRYSPYNYAYNNPISFIDPDGRKPQAPGDDIKATMVPTTMLMFYATGGSKNNTALMDFVGLPDNIGDFFATMDKLSFQRTEGGGSGGSGGSEAPQVGIAVGANGVPIYTPLPEIVIPIIYLTGGSSKWGTQIFSKFNEYMNNMNKEGGVYGMIRETSSYLANLISTTNEEFPIITNPGGMARTDFDASTHDKLRPGDRTFILDWGTFVAPGTFPAPGKSGNITWAGRFNAFSWAVDRMADIYNANKKKKEVDTVYFRDFTFVKGEIKDTIYQTPIGKKETWEQAWSRLYKTADSIKSSKY
jgi:RHS repeat-associated protein